MNDPRINASSIRYSQKVSYIIDSVPGKSFGDRFEFICLDFVEKMESRTRQLENIEQRIKIRQNMLTDCENMVFKLDKPLRDLVKIDLLIKECNTFIEQQLSDPADQVAVNVLQNNSFSL